MLTKYFPKSRNHFKHLFDTKLQLFYKYNVSRETYIFIMNTLSTNFKELIILCKQFTNNVPRETLHGSIPYKILIKALILFQYTSK